MLDIKSICHTLFDTKKVEVGTGGYSVLVDGIVFNKQSPTSIVAEVFSSWVKENPQNIISIIDQRDTALEILLQLAKDARNKPTEIRESDVYLTHDDKYPLDQTIVLVCPYHYKNLILYNIETGINRTVNKSYFRETIKLPKGVNIPYVDATQVYEPRLPPSYHELTEEEQELFPKYGDTVWNKYESPKYMKLPQTRGRLHPLLKKFFRHLFPTPEPRRHVLQWLRTLVSDYETTLPVLVLCGKAAIGKNTLVESIMVGLVGIENYHKAAQLSERFNSSIADCTLHFSDEGEVNGIIKRNLKGFHELYVAIERKGVDVTNPERIYARFVVATNNRRDVKLDYNDRKFSVPELTDEKLLDHFDNDEADWLFGFKCNIDAQREFRDYLVSNFSTTRQAYHGRLFEQICYESLPAWFRSFVKMLETGEEFSFPEFKKRSGSKNIAIDTVLHQIEQYEHQLGRKICEVREEDFSYFFIGIKE